MWLLVSGCLATPAIDDYESNRLFYNISHCSKAACPSVLLIFSSKPNALCSFYVLNRQIIKTRFVHPQLFLPNSSLEQIFFQELKKYSSLGEPSATHLKTTVLYAITLVHVDTSKTQLLSANVFIFLFLQISSRDCSSHVTKICV